VKAELKQSLNERRDPRGALVAIEAGADIPFAIKRVYYIYDTKGSEPRGFHAHRSLWQFAVCLNGACRMVMNDGSSHQDIIMDHPNFGVLVPPMVWHEMHDFVDGTVLMVLASEHYEESDYIRDRAIFESESKELRL